MQSRTAVRSISAAALAGGLTLGLGVAAPATAMPVHDRAESLGQLCHAAAQAQAGDEATSPPSSIQGLPGLRCGQAFGRAALAGDDRDETTETDATETEDASSDDDAYESDYAYESDDTSSGASESDEADDTSSDASESDEADEASESEDDGDAYESDGSDSDEQEHAEDGDHEDDDGGDWGEHSEHDD